MSVKKDTTKEKILIPPVWYKILKIWDEMFELINIEVPCGQKLGHFFLKQQAGAFGNNIGKEPQKPRPKLKNMYVIYILRRFALHAIQYKW